MPKAENYGDLITADHKVLSEGCESRNNPRYAIVVQDLATQWIQAYPSKTKTSQETQRSLQKFLEPNRKLKVIFTDNSLEFGKDCEDLSWNHLRQHHTDRKQMGLLREQCAESRKGHLQYCCNQVWVMNCGRIPGNVTAICETFKISCVMGRHHAKGVSEKTFNGPLIPIGAMVEYHPISVKAPSRLHQFGPKVLPGILLGYVLHAEENLERRHFVVADIEELEQMDESELHARRLNANEVLTPMKGEHFIFPVADGTVKISGGDQIETQRAAKVGNREIKARKCEKFEWYFSVLILMMTNSSVE